MKLTPAMLRKIVLEEAAKFGKMGSVEDATAKEVEADELADTVENKKDFTVSESKMVARLKQIKVQEAKLRTERLAIIEQLSK